MLRTWLIALLTKRLYSQLQAPESREPPSNPSTLNGYQVHVVQTFSASRLNQLANKSNVDPMVPELEPLWVGVLIRRL